MASANCPFCTRAAPRFERISAASGWLLQELAVLADGGLDIAGLRRRLGFLRRIRKHAR